MSGLDDIQVKVESPGFRHNALPILHEIRHALAKLVESGENTVIDLNAIPFGPGDEDELLAVLGKGEVSATVDALGPTLVSETGYAGVWLVDYRDADDNRIAFQIEVTETPEILKAHPDDMWDGAERLAAGLQGVS